MSNKGFSPKKRSRARAIALQALYQWVISQSAPSEIVKQYLSETNLQKMEGSYFEELFNNIIKQQEAIDLQLTPHLSRPLTEMDPIELSILRIAIYEFLQHPEIPYRVIINEAIELAKTFGATDGYKFVNGVLDKAVKIIRPNELSSSRS